MTTTHHLGITLVETSQAQKEVTVNEALSKMDAVLNTGAKDKDLATPPGSPANGDVYIVAASATGAWSGQSGKLAYYDSGWKFITPREGMTLWVNDEDKIYSYNGSSWAAQSSNIGKRALYIPATQMYPAGASSCAPLATLWMGSSSPTIAYLAFDPSTTEVAEFTVSMPKRWNVGTISASIEWSHAATTTNFGVVWLVQAMAIGDGDNMATAYASSTTLSDTGGNTDRLYKTAESSAFTIENSPAALDTVFFRILRDAANGGDTLAIDARLHGVNLYYTASAATDD